MDNRLAIGAEGVGALDFLAPFFFRAEPEALRVVYFEDAERSDGATPEQFERDLAEFGLGLHAQRLPSVHTLLTLRPSELVGTYLRAFAPWVDYTVQRERPTSSQVVRALQQHALTSRTPLELPLRRTRSCVRACNGGEWVSAKAVRIAAAGSLDFVWANSSTGESSSASPMHSSPLHCGGDYALLKTLTYGTPAYLPWYHQKLFSAPRAWFTVHVPFEPLYSARIVRRDAIRTLLNGQPVTYGFFWHFRIDENAEEGSLELAGRFPHPISRAFCDLVVRSTVADSVRMQEAQSVIDGALGVVAMTENVLPRLLVRNSGPPLYFEEVEFLAPLMIASFLRNLRRALFLGPGVLDWWAQLGWGTAPTIGELLARLDTAHDWTPGEDTRSLLLAADKAMTAAVDADGQERQAEVLSHTESRMKSHASRALVCLWDWAERAFRWSAPRSLALGAPPAPDAVHVGRSHRATVDLGTMKVVQGTP